MRALSLWLDLKYAVRSLAKQPFFTLIAVGTLALGTAGTTLAFSLFNGLFLRPFPVPHQERLVDLNETGWDSESTMIAYPDFHAWREHNQTFETMAAWVWVEANASLQGTGERVQGVKATHEFFPLLGIRPVLGRPFTAEEDRPGGPNVVLLSHGYWQRAFGGNPGVLGQTLRLDGRPFMIIGVLPPAADFPITVDWWRPLAADPEQGQDSWYLSGMGRLKPGVTVAQAREDLTRIHKALAEQRPANKNTSPTVALFREKYLGEYRLGTSILLGVVSVVLLMACCNAASLMLARGTARARELALRAALGAGRGHLAQQVLTESLLLAAAGGLFGACLGHWGAGLLLRLLRGAMDIPLWLTFNPDARSVLFCLGLVAVATVLSGIVPALQAGLLKDLRGALQTAGLQATASLGRRRTLNTIVVAQVAMALALFIGAGLLVRAFRNVQKVDPGFRTADILTYEIYLADEAYADEGQRRLFFERHLEGVRALPGVLRAGLISNPPLTYNFGRLFEAEGAPPRPPNEPKPISLLCIVTPGYFETVEVRLRAGRFFDTHDDRPDGERTAIVSQSFAQRFWPGEEAVGKRLRFDGSQDWMRVVGVTEDVKHYGLERPMRPSVYVPYGRSPATGMFGVVRAAGDPLALVGAIRELVRSADPALPVHNVKTMVQRVNGSLSLRLAYSTLFGLFAGVAGLMALAGIYGVTSYAVSQRTQEIGIRLALGAQRRDVLALLLRWEMRLAGAGLGLGLAGAWGLMRVLRSQLFEVTPTDLATYAAATLLLGAGVLLACWWPARQAARTDPMVALRSE